MKKVATVPVMFSSLVLTLLLAPLFHTSPALAAPAIIATPQAALLMTWYENADYQGASTEIRKGSGGCNSEGYGISYVGNGWNDRISSFKVWNNCLYTRAYTNANYGGSCKEFYGNIPYVGNDFNDRISSFIVTSVRHKC